MPEYVTRNSQRVKATDALLDELSDVHRAWQSERDYIRTVLEVHYQAANPDAQSMITALLRIVKAPRG